MFNAILWSQWKSARGLVLLTALLAFGLPLASLQAAIGAYQADGFVAQMQRFGAGYSVLAAFAGLLLAMAAWRPDQQGRHVYALSLPIARSRYTLFRFGAGAMFLVPTVVGVLLGSLAVALSGAIPEGLHAYPVALSLRFAFAAAVSYALFFAISSSTTRTAGYVIAILVSLVFAQYLLSVVLQSPVDVLTPVRDFLFDRPGVLSVFAGRWMLVDV